MSLLKLTAVALGLSLAAPAMAATTVTLGTTEGSTTDLFNGATATSNNVLGGFTAADAFGAVTSGGPYAESQAGGHVIFNGTANPFIFFSTANPVTIKGFVASLSSDGVGNPFRGLSGVSLYYVTGANYVLAGSSTALNPAAGPQTVSVTFAPIRASQFAFGAVDNNGGGRLLELDAIAAVPEPATWAMMIAGFGLIGAAMRRRRTVRDGVRFA